MLMISYQIKFSFFIKFNSFVMLADFCWIRVYSAVPSFRTFVFSECLFIFLSNKLNSLNQILVGLFHFQYKHVLHTLKNT